MSQSQLSRSIRLRSLESPRPSGSKPKTTRKRSNSSLKGSGYSSSPEGKPLNYGSATRRMLPAGKDISSLNPRRFSTDERSDSASGEESIPIRKLLALDRRRRDRDQWEVEHGRPRLKARIVHPLL